MRWVPFVANRVEKIQNAIPTMKWKHVGGSHNPADCAIRGFPSSELVDCEIWFQGPDWLRQINPEIWSENEKSVDDEKIYLGEKKTYTTATCEVEEDGIFERFSSWSRLYSVVSLCLTFLHNCCNPPKKCLNGFLTTSELKTAIMSIIKSVQQSYFSEEMSCLRLGKELRVHSGIIQLTPFFDAVGVIRVGGRIKNANIPETQRYPVLLPSKSHVTNLIITYYHIVYLHASQELLLSILRMQFWIQAWECHFPFEKVRKVS
ncbi:uncharacterized protein LOC111614313 [Centruroides sculpturatus]|uniref:uncharacterized protein LOC111614313 n=1 Tax=Centruroides sculpturatus TaxID=218467 RepID=UPI000C6DC453|nr:uncharacterized protein LOC111614313 [Centruroides sculpturatus]